MKLARNLLMMALFVALTACGGEEETATTEGAADTEGSAEAEGSGAAEAESEPAEEASTTYSCLLANHCREYAEVPYTLEREGGESMEITLEMVQGECETRSGTWSNGPCDDEGVLATCDEGHMVWHYREGANLESGEGICNDVRHGTWAAGG